MSHNKNMEDLLASARQLPTELTYDEVEFLFLNPTPPPTAQPWWRGGYLKFLPMFVLLIALLGFLLPAPAEFAPSALSSAFPVQENAPIYPLVDSLPVTSAPFTLEVPKIEIITPQVQVLAPKTLLAPAAAPKKPASLQDEPLLFLDEHGNLHNVTPPEASTGMPEALFSGNYSQFKDKLMLTFTEREDGPVNALFPDLSAAELKLFKKPVASPLAIERATGSLILYGDKKKGTFEFLPNTIYRTSLNNRGWGDAAAPDNILVMTTLGKLTEEEKAPGGRKPMQPHDQLWFRYFSLNINDDYIGLLSQAGYDNNQLGSLWTLANSVLKYEELEQILKLSSAVLTDTPPIEGLAKLKYDLNELKKIRSRGLLMTYDEFLEKNHQPILFENLTGVQGDATQSEAMDSYARNWSLEQPRTVVDSIQLLPGITNLKLKGRFKIRLNADLKEGHIVVWGPKNAIRALKKKTDYKTAVITNKRKRKTIYLEVSPEMSLMLNLGKGTSISRLHNKKE